jgi:hypothetical protein
MSDQSIFKSEAAEKQLFNYLRKVIRLENIPVV